MTMRLFACLDAVLNHRDRGCFVLAESRENREALLCCRRLKGEEESKALSKLEGLPFLWEISGTLRPAAEILSGIEKSVCLICLNYFCKLFPIWLFLRLHCLSRGVFQGC